MKFTPSISVVCFSVFGSPISEKTWEHHSPNNISWKIRSESIIESTQIPVGQRYLVALKKQPYSNRSRQFM